MVPSRSFGRALAVVSLLGIAFLTLLPLDGAPPALPRARFGERFGSDVLGNVLFFVPLGVALILAGLRFGRAAAASTLLSAALELLQLAIPGRYGSVFDVLANGLGGALGAGLAITAPRWLRPSPRAAARLVVGWSAALAGVFTLTAALLSPTVTPLALYGQWTANLGNLAWYRGVVHSASVGDVPLPTAQLEESERTGALLVAQAPLEVRATAGPPISELGPLFSVFDAAAREVLLVGVRGDDLVLRRRTWSSTFRLAQPELQVPNALAGLRDGDPLVVRVWRDDDGTCVAVNDRVRCGLGFSIASGWGIVRYPQSLAPWAATMDAVWLAALVLPLAYWSRRTRATAAAWATVLAGASVATLATDLVAPSVWVMLGGGLGALVGVAGRFNLR